MTGRAAISRVLADGRPANQTVVMRGPEAPLDIGRLRAEVAHNARRIAARGIRRGMLVCDASDRFVVGLFALFAAGADVMLPPNAKPGTLRALAGTFDLLVTDEAAGCGGAFVLEAAGADAALAPLDPERCRMDFFTSGSSGEPKRVEKTLALLEREVDVLEALWGERLGAAHVFGTVGHQHIFGLTFRVLWPLAAGRPFAARVHQMWEELIAELAPPTAIVSSPAHLTRLAGLAPLPPDLRPRMIFTAGAPLPAAAAREAIEIFGVEPTEIFGSTETSAVAWRASAAETAPWRPLPGVETSCNADGLLCVRSPFLAGDGLCQLADRVAITDDGGFRFEGRADRVVKIEGKRVSIPEVERQITGLKWIADAAVVPMTAGRSFIGAVAVLSAAGEAELARLGKFRFERMLRRELATTQEAAALPRRWRFVDRIPVDGMGKRRSAELAALLQAGH